MLKKIISIIIAYNPIKHPIDQEVYLFKKKFLLNFNKNTSLILSIYIKFKNQ